MPDRLRTLAGMLLLGALLAGARTALTPAPEPALALDDQTLLVEQALAAGWERTDPVVRSRLVDNLRFAGREGPDAALFEAALALGMARTDPVVRAHLASRARRALEAIREPTEAELEAWLTTHPDAFAREPVLVLAQERVGGPVAGIPSRLAGTPSQLGRRYGQPLAEAVAVAQPGDRVEATTPWGTHRIEVLERTPGGVPELATIRAEVRQAWIEAERARVLPERLAALRREAVR